MRATAATGGLALLGSLTLPRTASAAAGPYGPLALADANRMQLPDGFSARIIAVTDNSVGEDYQWHRNPDGGATFAQPDGGWVYVSNDESDNGAGGASMVRFNATGDIIDAASILAGTSRNCAGGATPWGTWLSCEEFAEGRVWECDPLGQDEATVRPALGVFKHEAAAADATRKVIYLTEDESDGALYRFAPDTWRDLSGGTLQVLTESSDELGWANVPDPSASSTPTRKQVASTKLFDGGEGAWFDRELLYFTTKGDNRVWRLDPATMMLEVIYDKATSADPILSGVDNVTVSASGDIFVCEDGGNMEVVMLTPAGAVSPFMRLDVDGSELTGVAFDPSGTRMYVSSQRNPGVTYEITGPFRPGLSEPSKSEPVLTGRGSRRRPLRGRGNYR